ncbi:MAG: hypothetical protein O4965_28595, partial [Trichodesmium sp. St19_bin1]|nr:hypothetical protein [Trichodesmium sp. St19_bin1]
QSWANAREYSEVRRNCHALYIVSLRKSCKGKALILRAQGKKVREEFEKDTSYERIWCYIVFGSEH